MWPRQARNSSPQRVRGSPRGAVCPREALLVFNNSQLSLGQVNNAEDEDSQRRLQALQEDGYGQGKARFRFPAPHPDFEEQRRASARWTWAEWSTSPICLRS